MAYYVTFYSYKGGVGRTMALANMAVALARDGRRVLVWELDLEAPGLLSIPYFASLQKEAKGGTLNLLAELPGPDDDWGARLAPYVLTHPEPKLAGRLRVLPAGPHGKLYTPLFNRVNWDRLFGKDSTEGSAAFAYMKDALASFTPEFVLIDSRTGITDIGGICTVQLADSVVLVYNLAHQNIDGARQVLAAIGDTKRLKAFRTKELDIIQVASMVPDEPKELIEKRLNDAVPLKPDFRIPLEARLLLEERLMGQEPELSCDAEYARLAERIAAFVPKDTPMRAAEREEFDPRTGREQRKGRRFEDKVAEVLRLLGYDVQRDVNVGGYQTDFTAEKNDPIQPVRLIGECKAHKDARGVEDITALKTRLDADRLKHPHAQAILVSASGFTKQAQEAAETFRISLRTVEELSKAIVAVDDGYLALLRQEYEGKEIERLYVPHNVVTEASPKPQALDEFVDNWLAQREQPFLGLLGDYGTGKTWFTQRLAAQLATRYQKDPARERFPLRVDLRSITRGGTLESVLAEHFQQSGRTVNIQALLYLLQEGRYTLIFDSFDEMVTRLSWRETRSTFHELARAAQGEAKVLLACRTHYFKNEDEVRQYVRGEAKHLSEAGTELYRELQQRAGFGIAYLPEFTPEQVNEFVRRAVPKDPAAVLRKIDTIDGLREIAARPVFLEMVIQSLPKLVRAGGPIQLAELYAAYTHKWIEQRDWQADLTPEARLTLLEELARELWQRDTARVHYSELYDHLAQLLKGKISNNKELEIAHADVRTASFLTRDGEGNYGFSHRSFLEYFVARRIAGRRDAEALRLRRLSPPVVAFVREMGAAPAVAELLRQPYEAGVSENALLVAQAAGCVPDGARLAGAQLAGWALGKVNFAGADLRGADLTMADLTSARLLRAKLGEAILVGAILRECDAEGADFTGADVSFADLVNSRGARVDGATTYAAALAKPTAVRPLVQGAQLPAFSVAFSPDGRLLAAGSGHTIRVYDAVTGCCRRILESHGDYVRSVAWSPNGTLLASGSTDSAICVWDIRTGLKKQTLRGHNGRVWSVAWSSVDSRLASGSDDGTVRVWNVHTGRLERTLGVDDLTIWSVAWSPNGSRLACGSANGIVLVWDTATFKLEHHLEGHRDRVLTVAWSADGTRLASGSDDKTVLVWNMASSKVEQKLRCVKSVWSLAWSPDGSRLACGSGDDGDVRLWDASGRLMHDLRSGDGTVMSISWSADGKRFATGSNADSVRIWDAHTGQLRRNLEGHRDGGKSVAWSPDGTRLASGYRYGNALWVWDGTSERLVRNLDGHHYGIGAVAWSTNGAQLAVASSDNAVRVWAAPSVSLLRELKGHQLWISSVAWSTARLASGSADKSVRVWEVATGRLEATLEGHTQWVWSVAWSPDGRRLASGSADKTVRIWDTASGKPKRKLKGHGDAVLSVAWEPDGKRLASASSDNTIRIWDSTTWEMQQTLHGHESSVWSVTWTADSSRLASGSADDTVRIWDTETGQLIRTLYGHQSTVVSVSWRADGARLASGSDDNTIRIWDAATGECLEIWYTFPDGGWLIQRLDGKRPSRGNAAGLQRLTFADERQALYRWTDYPELAELVADNDDSETP